MAGIEDILKIVGISSETLDRVRLGHGVMGRATVVAVAACVVLAIVAWGLKGLANPSLMVAGAVLVLFFAYLVGMLWFASRNPGAALLEGAELLTWQQLAAKALPNPPNTPIVPEPGTQPLAIPPPSEDESEG